MLIGVRRVARVAGLVFLCFATLPPVGAGAEDPVEIAKQPTAAPTREEAAASLAKLQATRTRYRYGAATLRETSVAGSADELLNALKYAPLAVPIPKGVPLLPEWHPAPEIWGPAQDLWLTTAGCWCAPTDGPGRVPDGRTPGLPFRIGKSSSTPGALDFSWSSSCSPSANDYAIEVGTLGVWYGHRALSCSTGGLTFATVQPPPGSLYYLVVPLNDYLEGSYGTNKTAVERPPSLSLCRGGVIPTQCP